MDYSSIQRGFGKRRRPTTRCERLKALGSERRRTVSPPLLPSLGIADTDMPETRVHADFGLEWWCLTAGAINAEVRGQSERGFEDQRCSV